MSNACGYEPAFDRIMAELHSYAEGIGDGFTDETWRQKVIPHILKTAFQNELTSCLDSIRTKHQQHPEIHNRQLMEVQMNIATQRLGEIFEKFTLALANKTDFLEAPLTFFPQKTAIPEGEGLTEQDRALLAAVPRHSLFASKKELQKRIAAEHKKLPLQTAEEALSHFTGALKSPVTGDDGAQKPYQTGRDLGEDNRRLIIGVLNLREMMQQYESRNFFSRWLTAAGRAERKAIREMKESLLDTLDSSAEQLETLLDLKTPLEKHVDLAKAMDILYKPKPEKTLTEHVSDVMEKTNEVIRDVTEVTLNAAGKMITTTAQIVSHPIQTLNEVTENVYNTFSELGNTVSNNVNTIMSEGILDGDFNDIDLGEDMDDLFGGSLYDRSGRPEPIKPEEPKREEPKPKQEESKQEESKQEESKQEEPPQESAGTWVWNAAKYMTDTVTNTASYAVSWLNPFNYSILGGGKKEEPLPQEQAPKEEQKQPQGQAPKEERESMPEPVLDLNDPVTYVQQKQMKVAYDIRTEAIKNKGLSPAEYGTAFAKLLCYKTLELSLKEGKIPADTLDTALSEDAVNQNVENVTKDPAFKKLDKLRPRAGIAKELKEFLAQVSKDPSAVNEIHKDYMQKKETLQASNASQPKESLQQQDPEKAPVVGGGAMG